MDTAEKHRHVNMKNINILTLVICQQHIYYIEIIQIVDRFLRLKNYKPANVLSFCEVYYEKSVTFGWKAHDFPTHKKKKTRVPCIR